MMSVNNNQNRIPSSRVFEEARAAFLTNNLPWQSVR